MQPTISVRESACGLLRSDVPLALHDRRHVATRAVGDV